MTLAFSETAGTAEFSTIRTFKPLGRVSLRTSNVGRSPRSVGFNVDLLAIIHLFRSIAEKKAYGSIVFVEIPFTHIAKLLSGNTLYVPNIGVHVVEGTDRLHLPEQDGLI